MARRRPSSSPLSHIGEGRFIVIAQSDQRITFKPVGAVPVLWNRKEFLDFV
jgi:hypothetical protein